MTNTIISLYRQGARTPSVWTLQLPTLSNHSKRGAAGVISHSGATSAACIIFNLKPVPASHSLGLVVVWCCWQKQHNEPYQMFEVYINKYMNNSINNVWEFYRNSNHSLPSRLLVICVCLLASVVNCENSQKGNVSDYSLMWTIRVTFLNDSLYRNP